MAALTEPARRRPRAQLVQPGREFLREAFWDWDLDTHRVSVSPQLSEMLGYRRTHQLPSHVGAWTRAVHPEDRASATVAWTEHCRGRTPTFEHQQRVRNAAGAWCWVLVRGQIVARRADGTPSRASGAISDVEEQRRADTSQRHARTLTTIGELTAGFTHELNTPIQYVGGNVQFLHSVCKPLDALLELCAPALEHLRASSPDPSFADRFAAAIDDADLDYLREHMPRALEESLEGIERIGKILRAVREFAHPGHDERIAADLNHAIETTITIAQSAWRDVANVVTELAPDLPAVSCWVDEINQVVLNLLLNASQAIREKQRDGVRLKGTITIGTRRVGDSVEIRVEDSGVGIPESIRERIFDPFFTTKEIGQGTGQGLSLTYATVVTRHGGRIRVESERHVGTTFFVTLPIAP